jgi:serine/threonine protein phosphatase PrpC
MANDSMKTNEGMCCGATDVGLRRENNQDQFLIAKLKKSMLVETCSMAVDPTKRLYGDTLGHLMLVADGMGGHAAGERASAMAIESLVDQLLNRVHWFFKIHVDAENEFIASLKEMLKATHRTIREAGERVASLHGMGTTLTMTYWVWPKMYVLHAGDSRCYLIRNGEVEQLTTDHTLARRMVDAGGLRPEDESTSRWSNVLWNVLGGKSEVDVTAEVRSVMLEEGDVILLCSDGLHRYIDDATIAQIIKQHTSPTDAVAAFIKFALDAGGEDNVTAIVARPMAPVGYDDSPPITKSSLDTTLRF